MSNNEIADKIELFVGKMFGDFPSISFGPNEYSIFFNPKKSSTWFIVFFYNELEIIKAALENGTCYEIHSYVLNQFEKDDDFANLNMSIQFENGNRPIDMSSVNNFLDSLIVKNEAMKRSSGKNPNDNCDCGHLFDRHQILFNNENEKIDVASHGWIICPEVDCTCFKTWSVNEN
jgi:hypothetical protein